MFHGIAAGVQLVGLAVLIFGVARVIGAPGSAARRSHQATAGQASAERQRYERGLIDFYRISGGIAILAGIILVLVPIFAG